MKIKDILIRQKDNKNIAITCGDTHLSYEELYRNVCEHMENIKSVPHNLNVGVFLPNSIDYVKAYFTICCNDEVIIPFESNILKDMLQSILEYCDITLVITNGENIQKLSEYLSDYKYSIDVYDLSSCTFIKAGNGSYISQSDYDEEDVVIMLHTSGTTSDPKKVMLTNQCLLANIESNIQSIGITSEDVCLIVLPMCFGYCNSSQFLTHFYLGARIVIGDTPFIPDSFLKTIDKEKCTNTTCVPSMLFLTIKCCKREKYELSSLRYLCFGGGVMPVDQLQRIMNFFDNTGIIQTYGQTEASPRVTCLLPKDAIRKIGSVGKSIPNVEVRIFDENDKEVACGESGQIVVRGRNIMKGYYKKPEITAETLKGGWLHTGDLGRFDDEGYLYIIGRIKNIIISGGLNIYPEEIEEVLQGYSGIKEVVVVSEHHDVLGEVPIAKVVISSENNFDLKELYQYCSERLPSNKMPSRFVICDKLEKTYNGKIKRF